MSNVPRPDPHRARTAAELGGVVLAAYLFFTLETPKAQTAGLVFGLIIGWLFGWVVERLLKAGFW